MKFEAKVAAGFQPKAIVKDEANNVGATCIVMDRSVLPFPFMLNTNACGLSLCMFVFNLSALAPSMRMICLNFLGLRGAKI